MPISYELHSKQEQPSGLILPNTLVRPIQQDPYAARQGSLVAKDCDSDRRCISEHPDSYRHAPCTHWEREAGRPPSQPGCAATTSQLPSARNADGPHVLPWQPLPPPPPRLPRHTGTRTRRQTWFQKRHSNQFKLTELQNSLRLRPASKSFYESAHRRTLNRKPANGLLAPRAP